MTQGARQFGKARIAALLLLVAGLLVGGPASKYLKTRAKAQERQARIAAQGVPWNGGKPTAPIELRSSVSGEIEAGEWVEVELELVPTGEGCVLLQSRARGLDGIEVSDDSVWDHPSCALGESIRRTLRVLAPEGVSGSIVLDLHMEMDSGMVYTVTRSVVLYAEGAESAAESN
jgi:hypothetical protein